MCSPLGSAHCLGFVTWFVRLQFIVARHENVSVPSQRSVGNNTAIRKKRSLLCSCDPLFPRGSLGISNDHNNI